MEDGQRDLVDPAVKGTKNVLSAVAKSLDSVKRVVLTSSFAGKDFEVQCLDSSQFHGVCWPGSDVRIRMPCWLVYALVWGLGSDLRFAASVIMCMFGCT